MAISMFYSEDDIRNMLTKREMRSVYLETIRTGDHTVMYKVDGDTWSKEEVLPFAESIFRNSRVLSAEATDGGLLITKESK